MHGLDSFLKYTAATALQVSEQQNGLFITAGNNDLKKNRPLFCRHRFEIFDKSSPYEMFVRELVAMDGIDTSEILLIDAVGQLSLLSCPINL